MLSKTALSSPNPNAVSHDGAGKDLTGNKLKQKPDDMHLWCSVEVVSGMSTVLIKADTPQGES